MKLLDMASLVIGPRYKSGKIYSVKPGVAAGDLAFARASVDTRIGPTGVPEVVASGVPSLDFTLGGCPSFRFKQQATNYITENNDLANTAKWTRGGAPLIDSNAIAWGILNGNRIVANSNGDGTSGTNHYVSRSTWTTQAGVNTFSVIVKKTTTHPNIVVRAGTIDATFRYIVNFNVDTLSYSIVFAGTNYTSRTGGVIDLGGGYYMCWETFTAAVGESAKVIQFNPANNAVQSFTAGNEIAFFAPQLSYDVIRHTSRIITSGSTATRVMDAPTLADMVSNGILIPSAGTIYLDINMPAWLSNTGALLVLDDGSADNQIAIYQSGNDVLCKVVRAGVATDHITLATSGTRRKFIFSFSEGAYKAGANGGAISTNAGAGALPAVTNLRINHSFAGGNNGQMFLNTMAIFPTILSNGNIQELTTL